MNNIKKSIAKVMIIALTVCSLMSGISAKAVTKAAMVPAPIVKDLKVNYKYNSTIKLNISSPNYSRKVKYKISLYNFSTKKSTDLTKGFSKSMSGSKTLVLSTSPKTSGKYALRIYVKALASKLSYDKYLEKTFNIEANKSEITSAILNASTLVKGVTVGLRVGSVPGSDKEKFEGIIKESLAVKNNIYASQNLIDDKIKALKVAVINFKNAIKQPTDNTLLITAIKAAQQKLNSTQTITEPSESKLTLMTYRNALSVEMADSVKVVVNRNATVQEVREAEIALNNAIAVFANKVQGIGINS